MSLSHRDVENASNGSCLEYICSKSAQKKKRITGYEVFFPKLKFSTRTHQLLRLTDFRCFDWNPQDKRRSVDLKTLRCKVLSLKRTRFLNNYQLMRCPRFAF